MLRLLFILPRVSAADASDGPKEGESDPGKADKKAGGSPKGASPKGASPKGAGKGGKGTVAKDRYRWPGWYVYRVRIEVVTPSFGQIIDVTVELHGKTFAASMNVIGDGSNG